MTKYNKPPLNYDAQANLLIERGLLADREELSQFLSMVNYYRFSGYLYPFREKNNDNFLPGTAFENIKSIYYFDAKLRLLSFEAIEVIDVAILRTQMVNHFTLQKGPFCYTELSNFNSGLQAHKHLNVMSRINDSVDHSDEEFVKKYKIKYYSEKHLPFWMISELSSFGLMSLLFQYLPRSIQVPISNYYNLHSRDLISWLHTLSTIRNVCAHHSRLWNRALPVRPSIPSKKHHPEFFNPVKMNNRNFFIVLVIIDYLLNKIDPKESFINEFVNLYNQHQDVPLDKMGFPKNWESFHNFN
jgi:abortive infection bacteriophage resistance protein